MRKTTPKGYLNRVAKENDKFRKTTKAKKRVMIAEDVIQLLKPNIIEAESIYISINYDDIDPDNKLRKEFRKSEGTFCEVCALGSAFLCGELRMNPEAGLIDTENTEWYNMRGNSEISKIFAKKQLCMIEAAFELTNEGELSMPQNNKSKDFGRGFERGNPRLTAIMQNIIDNKGTFKP